MLPSSSLNLIPVHILRPSVVFARSRPPVSSEPFTYAIVYPRHSKGNRGLPIVAVRSPKRRAANKLRGNVAGGRRQPSELVDIRFTGSNGFWSSGNPFSSFALRRWPMLGRD